MRGALLGLVAVGLLAGCGGGEIDANLVVVDRFDYNKPATLRETGELVSGTVVEKKTPEGPIVRSTDYVDGHPTGWIRHWYDNGHLRSESKVFYRQRDSGVKPWGMITIGMTRGWCENGTLSHEQGYDDNGSPTGQHRTWTCKGELLTVNTYPSGEYRRASAYESGEVWVQEEGTKDAEGKFEGEHKKYHQNGQLALRDNYKNGELDGLSKEWDDKGNETANGHYAAGKPVGTWRTMNNGWENIRDYDIGNYIDPNYAGQFAQAAGIQLNSSGWVAKLPLQDFRVDLDKLRYYVSEGLVDPKKKLNNGPFPDPFVSMVWTYAYVRASRGALETLVELGADPKAIDSDKRSRLHHCMFSLADNGVCTVDEVKRLIALGLPVDDVDVGNDTPLHDLVLTAWNWRWAPSPAVRLEVAKMLLEAGADPDKVGGRDVLATPGEGMSPLMSAAHAKQFDLARLLMERSKTPGATNKQGFNVIHLVFLDQNMQQFTLQMKDDTKAFVEYAAAKGVDPMVPIGELGTLKDVAQRAGAIDLAKFFSSLKR